MSNQTPQDPYLTNQPIPPHLQQHNVVGGSPLAPKPTVKPGSPPTKAERASAEADWKARWEATKGQATTWIPNPPTAWKSIPSGVRFAVWVWAISVIVSVAGAALFAILMVLGVVAVLGGQS